MALLDRHAIVGTAGHIDHGKSALVLALTGTDPDRLQEERERGITIDLGFAHFALEGGPLVGFIDVPGHERFVKNMLAGIGGIDAVLFVVAADESIMPQSREHLAICELLGVGTGVVAITKCDLADAELVDLVELEVRDLVEGTFLEGAPIVRCSARTGAGLAELRAALAEVLGDTAPRSPGEIVRLPVDRVFTVRGFGTVVTGTLLSGEIRAGDKLELLPGGSHVAVRGVQVYGEAVAAAGAGQRTAVNLQGVEVDAVTRGDVLATPAGLAPTHLLDVRLRMLPDERLKHLQRVRFHHGATEILARVAILDGPEIAAGGTAPVQLRLEAPYACVPGDRFVIRRYSPMRTIGGGEVIDNLPTKHRRRDRGARLLLDRLEGAGPPQRLAALVATAGATGLDEQHLRWRLGVSAASLRALAAAEEAAGRLQIVQQDPLYVVDGAAAAALEAEIAAAVAAYHDASPLHAGMPKSELAAGLTVQVPDAVLDGVLRRMTAAEQVRSGAAGISLPEHRVALDPEQAHIRAELLSFYEAGGWSPQDSEPAADPGAAAVREAVLHLLLRRGELVRLRDGLIFHAGQLARLIEQLRARHRAGEAFSVAEFKEWTGISRKHAIPLLEYLDQQRVTRRVGDHRVLV
ncbi:MAG TPA: selenocysteine-specific translation elongation factor [Acidobacteriota bacterium]